MRFVLLQPEVNLQFANAVHRSMARQARKSIRFRITQLLTYIIYIDIAAENS